MTPSLSVYLNSPIEKSGVNPCGSTLAKPPLPIMHQSMQLAIERVSFEKDWKMDMNWLVVVQANFEAEAGQT